MLSTFNSPPHPPHAPGPHSTLKILSGGLPAWNIYIYTYIYKFQNYGPGAQEQIYIYICKWLPKLPHHPTLPPHPMGFIKNNVYFLVFVGGESLVGDSSIVLFDSDLNNVSVITFESFLMIICLICLKVFFAVILTFYDDSLD